MNREHLLHRILICKELKCYWPDIDIKSINYNNLINSDQNNKYLRSLYYLLSDDGNSKKAKLNSVLNIFKIQP
jgi:hypothetical protein